MPHTPHQSMFILCFKDKLVDVGVGVSNKFGGEFCGQAFVYLPVPARTSVHSRQNLSPEVLVTPTWVIHACNIIFYIGPHQLNWLGLCPIRDSPDYVPAEFLEPAHHTCHSELGVVQFDVVVTSTTQ